MLSEEAKSLLREATRAGETGEILQIQLDGGGAIHVGHLLIDMHNSPQALDKHMQAIRELLSVGYFGEGPHDSSTKRYHITQLGCETAAKLPPPD